MEAFPGTLAEFEARFSSVAACREYLSDLRWPDGFRCPSCSGGLAWRTQRGLMSCKACGHQTSVTAGTIFQDSRLPLTTWFRAIWWMCGQKTGVSALGLRRLLGLGSYETAWTWLHKFRRAMVTPDRDRLSGKVEVNETYWGRPRTGKSGRGALGKEIILVAAQVKGPNVGRIRLARVPDLTTDTISAFIKSSIEPGSTLRTDGFHSYRPMKSLGYRHEWTVTGQATRESQMLPRAHLVASLLKRWLLGTHQGAIKAQHLDYYLDEFTFRFNRRSSRARGKLFYRLLQNGVTAPPAPYRKLVEGRP